MVGDRRCAPRWPIKVGVRYVEPRKSLEGSCRTEDLGPTGAKITMVNRCKPGDRIFLALDLPGGQRDTVCVEADVVWQDEMKEFEKECNYLTGIAFRKITESYRKFLISYVSGLHARQEEEEKRGDRFHQMP